MRDKNNVLVWLHVELVISLKTFMLIHNKGLSADRENRGNISTSHGYLPTINRVPFVILSKASLNYQSAFCDYAFFCADMDREFCKTFWFCHSISINLCLPPPDQNILKLLCKKYRFINLYFLSPDCIHHHNFSGVPWRQQALNNWWAWKLRGSACNPLGKQKAPAALKPAEASKQASVRISIVFRQAKHLVLRQCNTVSLQ